MIAVTLMEPDVKELLPIAKCTAAGSGSLVLALSSDGPPWRRRRPVIGSTMSGMMIASSRR